MENVDAKFPGFIQNIKEIEGQFKVVVDVWWCLDSRFLMVSKFHFGYFKSLFLSNYSLGIIQKHEPVNDSKFQCMLFIKRMTPVFNLTLFSDGNGFTPRGGLVDVI